MIRPTVDFATGLFGWELFLCLNLLLVLLLLRLLVQRRRLLLLLLLLLLVQRRRLLLFLLLLLLVQRRRLLLLLLLLPFVQRRRLFADVTTMQSQLQPRTYHVDSHRVDAEMNHIVASCVSAIQSLLRKLRSYGHLTRVDDRSRFYAPFNDTFALCVSTTEVVSTRIAAIVS